MTNSRFASIPRTSLKIKAAFVKYLTLLVFLVGALFTQVSATITVNSTPQTNNDFCGTGSPSLILPIVATSNCGSGTITYQWYVGSTFGTATAITAAGTPNYSGWNTSTLNVNNASALGTNTTYWAVATESSGACSDADTLGPFNYIKVTSVPTVTLTSSFDICEGDEAVFAGAVTAPSPAGVLTYVWSKTPDGGAAATVQTTSNVLTLVDTFSYTTLLTDDQDDIDLAVTNACGTGTATTSTLSVNPRPVVTVASSQSTLSACENGAFTIEYTISNAEEDASSGGAGVNWSIVATGDAALVGLLTVSGTGSGTETINVPGGTLTPGSYSATITTITNTSSSPTCARSVSTNTINVNIYPEPIVTFSTTPSNICNGSGSGTSFAITVSNAEYSVGGTPVSVNWSVTLTEQSFTQVSGCTGGSAGLLSTTITGNGNTTNTYTIPTSMGVGIYQYTLTGVTNTSNSCTGTVGATPSVDWRVDPTPNITVIPTSSSVCEGATNTGFSINVTNTSFCGTTAGSGTAGNVNWSLPYTTGANQITSTTSNLPASPITDANIGTGIFTTNTGLSVGTHVFDPTTITVTTPAAPGCNRDVSSKTFTLTVNPEPVVTFSTASITMCEGSVDSFTVDVTNAVLNSVDQNWQVFYSQTGASAVTTTPCAAGTFAGILPATFTGSGNGSTKFYVPATLAPGYYTYTLTAINNTSAGCTAGGSSVGATPTITIIVEPRPIITMNPETKDACETDAESFNLSITNATGCSAISTTSTADWTITVHTDDVQSDATTVIGAGLNGTGDQSYTINVNTLTTLTPNDHIFDASVANTTGGTSCTGSSTRDTFTLSVDPRPEVQINGAAGPQVISVCQGTLDSFSFNVTNALHNGEMVNWEITYTEASGQVSSGCNGAATADLPGASGAYIGKGNTDTTIYIPSTLPVGQYTYTLTNIVNTDGPCTGEVDNVTFGPQVITINVYPTPTFTVQPDSSEVCENNVALNDFYLVVSNAQYCSNTTTLANAPWEISGITDNVASNAPDPITGSGNGSTSIYNSNVGAALTAGSYTYTATVITSQIVSPTALNCPDSVLTNNTHVLTVNPAPDASFTAATVSVCEGNTGTVTVAVSNAVLNSNPVNWSFDVSESTGNLTSACIIDAGENASLVRDTTGSGNNAGIVYNIPDNLVPGVYTYTISNVLNTDEGCAGTSVTSTVTVYVYPKLEMVVTPAADEVCEGETTTFDIDVTNARYCSALNTASTNVPWTLTYTDATASDIFPDPLTGSGNSSYTFTANTAGLLSAGVYEFVTATITGNIVTPTTASCPVSVPDTFTLTVNPEPVVTFSTNSVNVCEGSTGTFDVLVSNAQYTTGSSTVEADWTVDMIGDSTDVANACASGGSGAGLFGMAGTNNLNGTGDTTISVTVPATLAPGVYTYTLNGIVNTSNTCTGSIGAVPTVTIIVYPQPDVDLSTDTLIVCENTTSTFDLTITNAQYCASIGGSLINVNWEVTHTDGAQSNMPASVWAGSGNMSATTYTVNTGLALTAGGSPYSIDISQIENITHSCVNTDSFTGTELTVIVNDLPVLTINSVSSSVCDGSSATITYSVSDVESTDAWSFTFTTDGGTTNHTVSGVGPVSSVDTFTVALTPPGVVTVGYSAITNNTTGCVGNTPGNNNVTVLNLPDVTSFVNVSGTNVCSGSSNDYNITVTNAGGKSWEVFYTIDGVAAPTTWTGTGTGTFTQTVPTQYHQDSTGAFDSRPLVIDSIRWTGGAGTPPLCVNTSVTDPNAVLNIMPNPWINLIAPSNVCINYTADITYFVGGVRNTDIWDFDWYTTGPTDGPNNITGSDTTTGTFTTLALTPVGTSNVNVPTVTNTSTGCDSSYSSSPWSEDIIVDPPTVPGTLTPNYTICDGDVGPYTFNLTGYTGTVQNWDSSDNDGFTWINIGNTTDSHTVVSPHLTTRYHVVVKSGACPADTSNEVILFVHPQPAATIVSVNDSICEGSNIDVVLNVSGVPNTHGYSVAYTVTNGTSTSTGTWTGTGSSATISETLTNGGSGYTAGTWSVILESVTNTNTGCDTTLTDTATVLVKSNPVGSTASAPNDTLCANSNGIVVWDGTAADGYVVAWQKKVGSGAWTTITGSAGDTLEFISLSTTTQYRAVIENAPCTGQAFSSAVTITVLTNNPLAEWDLPASLKFCASATATTNLTYDVTGTNGYDWTLILLEGDSTHTITGTGDVNDKIFTTSPGRMEETFNVTLVKITISAGTFSCTKNLDNTGITNVTIIDLPTATLNSVTSTVCDGQRVTASVTVGQIKTSQSWKLNYTINGVAKDTTGTGPGTFTFEIPYSVSGGNSTQTVALVSIENTTAMTSASTTCTNSQTGSLTYDVKAPTSPGTIASSDSVCYNASGSITQSAASSNGGVITDWLVSTDGGSNWSSTGNTSTTQTYSNITTTTHYRAVYTNSPCDTASSNTVVITVLTLPSATIGMTAGNDTICQGATTSVDFTVTNVENGQKFTLYWTEGATNKSMTFTNNASNAHSFTTGAISSNTDVTLTKIETTSRTMCSNPNLSSTATITVLDNPAATIASNDTRLCHGSTVDFTVTVSNVATTDNWTLVYTLDGTTETVTGTGAGTFSFTTSTTVTSTSDVLALVSITNTSSPDNCSSSLSDSKTIAVDPTTVAGVITEATDTICKGGSTTISQTTAGTGVIVGWEYMAASASSWTGITNTSTTLNVINLQETTSYRAVYQSGLCATANSNVVTINVLELPVGTLSISAGNDTICAGTTTTIDLTVSNIENGQTFTIYYVEGSSSKTMSFTNNASNSHTFTTGTISTTTDITLTRIETTSRTMCTNSNLNTTVTVTVQENPLATIASNDSRLCHGSTVDFSVTVSNVATTDDWTLVYTLDGTTETATGTGAGTFSFTTTKTVTSTSDVLALVSITNNTSSDNCNTSLSESKTIAVDPTTVAGVIGTYAISRDTIVCKGGSGYVKEFTTGTGSIVKWQSRKNGTTTWVDINSTNNTQFFFNLLDTTEFRAVYQSGVCSTDASAPVTATPKNLPYAEITAIIDDSICAGTTGDFEITVDYVDVGADFTVYFSEGTVGNSASFTQNASGVHTITSGVLTSTTLIQLVAIEVTNSGSASIPACSNTLTSNGTITVVDLPFASITAGPDTLCQQDKITFTVTVTNVLSTDNWMLRYELENDEDTITGTGPGSVTWTDTDSNTAESAKIQLIEILNVSNLGICKSVNTDDWDIYIYKPTEPGTIEASTDTICKGGSTTISEVTGTPKQGVTVSWEYRPISTSNWTGLTNNNTTLTVINLLETTDYRAIYKSGVCDTAHSNVVRIQVEELPLATISGSTTICAGDSVDLTVTVSNVGSIQDWEIDYLAGTLSGLMTGTGSGTHTLRVGNFTTNSDVILQEIRTVSGTPQCVNDKLTNNAQARVNINQRPYASLNSTVSPVCQNNTSSFTFTVSNVKSGDDWTLTYQVDDAHSSSVTTTGKGPGTFTVATPTLTDDKTYVVRFTNILNTTTGCDSSLSSTMDIVVDATTTPGSVASDTTVCYGAHVGTVTHTGGNGSIIRWETSIDGGTSWSTISNTNSTYTYTNLTTTTLYRVVKMNGVCVEAATAPVTITVNELPVASISGSDTVCAGESGNLTVSVINAQGEDWKVSYLVGTVIDTLSVSGPLTTGTINTGSIKTNTDVTLKKVWMTSGTPQCENNNLSNNAKATVEVDDEPNATLISLTDSVCTGSPAYGKVTVSDVRTSENWIVYWSINGGTADSVTGTGPGSFNFTTANLTVDPSTVRLTRIVNTTTGCEGSPTDQDVVTVSPTTVGGTLTANDTVCKGSNNGTLTLGADAIGTVMGWEYSTNSGATWTSINNTSSTYTYNNLTLTTQFRVIVKSGACNTEYSSVVTITVNELPVATIASVGANRICEGSSTFVALSVTNVGAGMDWELKYLQGSSVKTLTGSGPGADTIWTGTLSSTTDITLQSLTITSGSPQCTNTALTNQYTTTITVIENPFASIKSYPTDICKGETPTVTVEVDDVLSSEAWTLLYRVNNGSTITSTGVGSGTFTLANMPQFNTEGPNGVRLVSITNTSSNPNCTSALSDSITINVDSTSVGGSISGVSIVCKGDGGTLSLSGHRGSIVKWQYSTDGINYYDIANTSDTLAFANLQTKTWYRVEVMNGVCSPVFSSVKTVDIQELPTVTINNPTINICEDGSTTLSLTIGNVTSSSTWSIDYEENGTAGTYSSGTGTTETITFGPYSSTTTIEILSITVTNGLGCSNTISEKAVVTVTPNPIATITTVPDSLCQGDILVFTASIDNVASGTKWELDYEVDGTAGPTKKGTGSGTVTINTGRSVSPNLVKVQLTEIALDNSLGCNTLLNDSAEIKVSPTSVGGTLSPATSTICEGGSVTLTLSGETGAVQNWEYSTDNGATWAVLSNNSKSVTINNINVTTLYRVFVKSGTCSGAYSTVSTVTVIETPSATVTSSAMVCPGDVATFTLHVTGVPATDGWSMIYKRNGVTVGTAVTGTGSGDFNFNVTGSTYNGNPTLITVELVSIENTTYGCTNSNLNSSATARVTPNPVAGFNATNNCEDSTISFTNTSSIAEGSIATYKWYFGDGDSSINGSPSHTYAAAGTYNVTLVVWSDNGCRGEITKTVEVYPNPTADFTFSNVCKNETFSATDRSSVSSGSITSWFWQFGDGTTSTDQNPTHDYAASGNYDVTLTVVTNNGCSNTVSKELTVYILPEANFVASPVCEDAPMQFVNASAIGYGTMTYEWNFAGQGNSTDKDPVFTFTGFGTFSVELIATSNNGCKDTIVRNVTVYPAPTADFTVADVCIGDPSVFVNTSTVPGTDNIVKHEWDFGDNLSSSTLVNPTFTYAAAGDYNVTLTVTSNRGCVNSVTNVASVIALPDVDLTANGPTEFCDGDSVVLSANSNARTYDWTWDGGTSSNSSVTAKTNGWYKVRITAPPIGCANEDSIFITVHQLPDAKAWPRNKVTQSIDTISRGQSIDLHASGGVTYLWSPTTYLNPSDMADVMAERVDMTTDYTVTVTDEFGCTNEAQLRIFVLNNFDLTVYNAVTPNGDGMNDTWIVENIWAYPEAEVVIFNRYGMEVYRTTGYNNDWDATYKGNDLPDGPYYYVIVHPDFETVYKGVINVIRETK